MLCIALDNVDIIMVVVLVLVLSHQATNYMHQLTTCMQKREPVSLESIFFSFPMRCVFATLSFQCRHGPTPSSRSMEDGWPRLRPRRPHDRRLAGTHLLTSHTQSARSLLLPRICHHNFRIRNPSLHRSSKLRQVTSYNTRRRSCGGDNRA